MSPPSAISISSRRQCCRVGAGHVGDPGERCLRGGLHCVQVPLRVSVCFPCSLEPKHRDTDSAHATRDWELLVIRATAPSRALPLGSSSGLTLPVLRALLSRGFSRWPRAPQVRGRGREAGQQLAWARLTCAPVWMETKHRVEDFRRDPPATASAEVNAVFAVATGISCV